MSRSTSHASQNAKSLKSGHRVLRRCCMKTNDIRYKINLRYFQVQEKASYTQFLLQNTYLPLTLFNSFVVSLLKKTNLCATIFYCQIWWFVVHACNCGVPFRSVTIHHGLQKSYSPEPNPLCVALSSFTLFQRNEQRSYAPWRRFIHSRT